MPHANINIFGEVQGVGFRYYAKQKADGFHLTGFARNESDGTVHIEIEGEADDIKKFLSWCNLPAAERDGSLIASVRVVNVEFREKLDNFSEFVIQ